MSKLTWNQLAVIILAYLLASIGFGLSTPFWLIPPYIEYTYLMYFVTILVWLVILFIGMNLKPIGSKLFFSLVWKFGAVVTIYIVVISICGVIITTALNISTSATCKRISEENASSDFVCNFAGHSDGSYYFKQVGNWPLVKLVNIR